MSGSARLWRVGLALASVAAVAILWRALAVEREASPPGPQVAVPEPAEPRAREEPSPVAGDPRAAVAAPQLASEVARAANSLARLVVTVVDSEGATPGGVGVRVRRAGREAGAAGVHSLFTQRWGATDAVGVARFDDLDAGTILVQADRGTDPGRVVALSAGETAHVQLEVRGIDIELTVLDAARRPLGDASVRLSAWPSGPVWELGTTDSQGRFTIRAASPECAVGAACAGFAASPMHVVHESPGARRELEIVLQRGGGEIAGTVRGPDGAAIEGAIVRVAALGGGVPVPDPLAQVTSVPPRYRDVRTTSDGAFAFQGCPSGEAALWVRAPQPALAPWVGACHVVAGAPTRVEVDLALGMSCRGVVRDAGGGPVADADVGVANADPFLAASAVTTADGSYALLGLVPGPVELAARHEQRGRASTTRSGGPGAALEWSPRLEARPELTGVVVDPDGAPVPDLQVIVGGERADWAAHDDTDEQGLFRVPDCPDDSLLHLTVSRAGVQLARLEALDPRQGPVRIEVPVGGATGTIRGFVVGPDGNGVGDARISPFLEGATGGRVYRSAADTGAFVVDDLVAGTYGLLVDALQYPPRRLDVGDLAPGATWDAGVVQLLEGGTVRVQVLPGPIAADPVLRVFDADLRSFGRLVGPDPCSRALEEGGYFLSVGGDGLAAQWIPVQVVAGRETLVPLHCAPGFPVSFEIELPDSAASARIELVVRSAAGAIRQRVARRAESSRVSWSCALEAGSFEIEATAEGGLRGRASIQVAEGGPAEPIRLALE